MRIVDFSGLFIFFATFAEEKDFYKGVILLVSLDYPALHLREAQTFTARGRLQWPVVRAGVDFLFLF